MIARLQRRGALRRAWLMAAGLLVLGGGAMAAEPVAAPVCSDAAGETRLLVKVLGMRSAKGNVTITVYPDDVRRFLAPGGKLLRQRVPVTGSVTAACFVVPAAGVYAIAIYHDEDDNHHFNRSFIGLPTEGYGFSQNPKTLVGLPSLNEVRFTAKLGDNPIDIRLSY